MMAATEESEAGHGQSIRRAGARRQPVPDGRGPAQAEERERDTFKSERPLRRRAAAGLSAKRAKFKFVSPNEPDWPASGMRAALKAARQGYYAWESRPRAPAPCATPNWPSLFSGSGTRPGTSTARPRRSCGCERPECGRDFLSNVCTHYEVYVGDEIKDVWEEYGRWFTRRSGCGINDVDNQE